MKLILVFLFLIGITSCKTVEYVAVTPTVPSFEVVKPDRPILETSTEDTDLKVNIIRLMTYSRQLEAYIEEVDKYLQKIQTICIESP